MRLIDKPRERRKLAKRAARWSAAQALSKNLGAWEAQLDRVVELRRRRAAAGVPRSAA